MSRLNLFRRHTFEVTHILSVCPLLTIQLQIPCQRILEVLLVRIVREIELLVLVALPIRSTIHCKLDIVTFGDEHTTDDGVVGLAEDTHRSEQVLSRGLKAIEETADLVRRHEDERQLAVVLEVASPDGEPFLVEAGGR